MCSTTNPGSSRQKSENGCTGQCGRRASAGMFAATCRRCRACAARSTSSMSYVQRALLRVGLWHRITFAPCHEPAQGDVDQVVSNAICDDYNHLLHRTALAMCGTTLAAPAFGAPMTQIIQNNGGCIATTASFCPWACRTRRHLLRCSDFPSDTTRTPDTYVTRKQRNDITPS